MHHPENVPYAYLGLRHSAQTLLAPEDYDLKDFVRPVPEEAQGGFVEGVLALQGEVLILEAIARRLREQFQALSGESR